MEYLHHLEYQAQMNHEEIYDEHRLDDVLPCKFFGLEEHLHGYDQEQRQEYECMSVPEPVRIVEDLPCLIQRIDRCREDCSEDAYTVDPSLPSLEYRADEIDQEQDRNEKANEEERIIARQYVREIPGVA